MKYRTYSKATRNQAIVMLREGKTGRAVATALGIPLPVVYDWKRRHTDVRGQHKGAGAYKDDATWRTFAHLAFDRHMTPHAAAGQLGISPATACRMWRDIRSYRRLGQTHPRLIIDTHK